MDERTLIFFKKLSYDGYITREREPVVFSYYDESIVREELEIMMQVLDFSIYRVRSNIYMIPTQANELFLQGNDELKRSIGSGARLGDIYLTNFIGIFILNIFFGGSGDDPQIRNFIGMSDLISEFSEFCENVSADSEKNESASKAYSIDFVHLAESWLAKTGDETNSFDTKYGCMSKVIRKFRDDELLNSDNPEKIKPTRKLIDLMPYFLRQDRITEINSIFKRRSDDADNQ